MVFYTFAVTAGEWAAWMDGIAAREVCVGLFLWARVWREGKGREGEGRRWDDLKRRTSRQKAIFGEDGDGIDEEDRDCVCWLAL